MIELRPNEKIIAVARRHWLILVLELLPSASLFVVVFFLPVIFGANIIVKFISGLAAQVVAVIFLTATIDYLLDAWTVTNERTIYAELLGFFRRQVSSVPHDKIQDITMTIPGFFATVFHYGNLQIQTAGEFHPMIMKMIPRPDRFKSVILDAQAKLKNQLPAKPSP